MQSNNPHNGWPAAPLDFHESVPSLDEGYARALDLLRSLATPDGFVAAPIERANYRRIWSRDGVIIGLAVLQAEDDGLIAAFRRTLLTLARHQGPQGEIPSNVDTAGGRVSYGGTTGRVDADLWFVVGCAEYWQATGDDSFLNEVLPCAKPLAPCRAPVPGSAPIGSCL